MRSTENKAAKQPERESAPVFLLVWHRAGRQPPCSTGPDLGTAGDTGRPGSHCLLLRHRAALLPMVQVGISSNSRLGLGGCKKPCRRDVRQGFLQIQHGKIYSPPQDGGGFQRGKVRLGPSPAVGGRRAGEPKHERVEGYKKVGSKREEGRSEVSRCGGTFFIFAAVMQGRA